MRFLTLISDLIGSILDVPYRILGTIGRFRLLRSVSGQVTGHLGSEVRQLSPAAAFFRGLGFVLLVLLAVAAVGGAVYGLWRLNRLWELERQLGGPLPWARGYWLPALFVLFLGAAAAGWWLWTLVGPAREPTDFPDIHAAWVEGRAALEANGLGLADLPLFLVVGRPAAGPGGFFAAARAGFTVNGVPARGDAPVQVFAGPQGIFVACPKLSLLTRWADLLTAGGPAGEAAAARTLFDDPPATDPRATVPLAATWDLNLLPEEAPPQPAAIPPEPPEERPRAVPSLLGDAAAADRELARLRYLGRLLAYNRHPYCGANGVVLLVPFAGLDGEAAANQTAAAVKLDLDAARAGLGVDAPVLAVVADLERAAGAGAFLRAVGDDRRGRLLGQPFPLAADAAGEKLEAAVRSAVRWTADGVERLAQRAARTGVAGPGDDWLRHNTGLCRFVAAVREREATAGAVFAAAAAGPDGRAGQFGGGFFAATGPDEREQAFVPGLVTFLAEQQNFVTWTPAARAEDAAYRTWATVGYLSLGAFILAVAALVARQVREAWTGAA